MRAFVTGATGFVGGAVVRRLLAAGHSVRALVRPGADLRQLAGLSVELCTGDLSAATALRAGLEGCDWALHVAALYSYWGHTWDEFYQANVEGTRRVILAARTAGVQRVVYTSSIVALGHTPDGSPADEDTPVTLADKQGSYARSKYLAEQAARELAAQGAPVVIVNPSVPMGVGDFKPTPTGQMILDYLNGRLPGYVNSGLNIVDVEDVAAGHLLAAERGRVGERYILGGENLSLARVLDLLAEVSGGPRVRLRVPHGVALGWGYLDVAAARLFPRHTPTATPEKVRQSRWPQYFDSGKAIRELGLPQTPARATLRKAVEWYRANGYVRR
jgi:dihydroflavonol-4-reductase